MVGPGVPFPPSAERWEGIPHLLCTTGSIFQRKMRMVGPGVPFPPSAERIVAVGGNPAPVVPPSVPIMLRHEVPRILR